MNPLSPELDPIVALLLYQGTPGRHLEDFLLMGALQ